MDILAALASGALAGIALAAPLGAIGVLLVREGLAHGFRSASPAAIAVALVDAGYCAAAVIAGAVAAPVIATWGAIPAVVGGVVLIALGLVGIVKAVRAMPADASGTSVASSRGRRFALFIGLTAINPATLVYFAALTVALGGTLASVGGAVAFVAGVAVASCAWQLGLVLVGSYFRGRITARAQRTLSIAGYTIIVVLGAGAIVAATL